nr:hypothetical protein [Tanacetum cinerariifolium]
MENADYANEPEEEDPEEEDHEEEDPKEEESNDIAASEEEPLEGFDDTEPSKEDKTAVTPPPSRIHGARISIHLQTPMLPLYEDQVAKLLSMDTPPPSPLTPIDRGTLLEDAYIKMPKDLLRYEARNESLEAHNRSLVARIETIETRMTKIEDQFQDTRDYAVSHVMHTQALEARA